MFDLAEQLKAFGLWLEDARDWFSDADLDFKYVVLEQGSCREIGRYNSLKPVRALLKAEQKTRDDQPGEYNPYATQYSLFDEDEFENEAA